MLSTLGACVALAVKVSSLGTAQRYLIMGLGLGFCIVGVQLFISGIVGELVVYLFGKKAVRR